MYVCSTVKQNLKSLEIKIKTINEFEGAKEITNIFYDSDNNKKTKEMLKYIEVELGLKPYSYDLKNPSIDTKYLDKLMGNDKLHVLRDATVYKKRY